MIEGQVVAKQDEAVTALISAPPSAWAACRCPRDGFRSASADRRPVCASLIEAWTALTSDDLPMPRAPHRSTLLAGRPAAKRCVLSTRMSRTRSTPRISPMSTRFTALHRIEVPGFGRPRRNNRRRRDRLRLGTAAPGVQPSRSAGRVSGSRFRLSCRSFEPIFRFGRSWRERCNTGKQAGKAPRKAACAVAKAALADYIPATFPGLRLRRFFKSFRSIQCL